ncbi:MAG: hemolysin family protein [Alphaproteobacteria bacterium]|nr:hemolysin family protein [Alphaproteobacteria bacterium]
MTTPPPSFSDKSADSTSCSLKTLWRRIVHWARPPVNADVLREVVEELMGEPPSETGVSQAERLLLSNIMKLRERRVDDCMVPRADIVALDVNSSMKELVEEVLANGYSRVPIYRGTLDDVIGMVHVKDLVPFLARQKPCLIPDILRPVLYVAPSMPAFRLLLQMRQTRQHMAVVIDEFGGVDGLVTIEDLVEEIVGEIEDEHDVPEPPSVLVRADGTLLADARLPLDIFEEKAHIALPPLDGEDVDTLGGYVMQLAGRVPLVGDIISGGSMTFEILEMEQSRVARVRIRLNRKNNVGSIK